MFGDDLSKTERLELALNVLNQALQKLSEHDYFAAQSRISFARQVLEEVQLDFDLHFQAKQMLDGLL
jgi:hypothetical protein